MTTTEWSDDPTTQCWFHAFTTFPEPDALTAEELKLESLPIVEVYEREDVFQTRQFHYTKARSVQHVKGLTSQLRTKKRLAPIWVWKAGGRFIVLDGHHRLAAYKAVAAMKKAGKPLTHIPVKVFDGSKQAAYDWAVSQNVEDKENMNYDDKMEAGWRRVVVGVDSRKEIAEKSGISQRTASTMRESRKRAQELHPLVDFRTWTWVKVKALLKRQELPEELEARERKQVAAYVQGLTVMKAAPVRKARLIARAMRQYDATWADDVAAENHKLKSQTATSQMEQANADEEDEF